MPWLDDFYGKIKKSDVVVFILTEESIKRFWVGFELGAVWEKYDSQHAVKIIPVSIGVANPPLPWANLQIMSLTDVDETTLFFQRLVDIFGRGQVPTPRTIQNLVKRIAEALKQTPPPTTPESLLAEAAARTKGDLSKALQHLITSGNLPEPQIDIFIQYGLLDFAEVQQLKQLYKRA